MTPPDTSTYGEEYRYTGGMCCAYYYLLGTPKTCSTTCSYYYYLTCGDVASDVHPKNCKIKVSKNQQLRDELKKLPGNRRAMRF